MEGGGIIQYKRYNWVLSLRTVEFHHLYVWKLSQLTSDFVIEPTLWDRRLKGEGKKPYKIWTSLNVGILFDSLNCCWSTLPSLYVLTAPTRHTNSIFFHLPASAKWVSPEIPIICRIWQCCALFSPFHHVLTTAVWYSRQFLNSVAQITGMDKTILLPKVWMVTCHLPPFPLWVLL